MTILQKARLWVILILLLNLSILPASSASEIIAWQRRVDSKVLEDAKAGEAEFIIFLSRQADLSQAAYRATKLEKGQYVYETLSALASQTQQPVVEALQARGIPYRSYWVANMIWAVGDLEDVQAIASLPTVSRLHANPKVQLDEPSTPALIEPLAASLGVEWNIHLVNAEQVWAAGYTGQGAVVASADTGVDWTHPALKAQYRGWDGTVADHNYSWHDAIHNDVGTNGNPCGFDTQAPCGDTSHGTHTVGIMVGDDSAGNQIGMAPGARWIACRNMEETVGSPITYAECYQWFIAPTDLNDQNPDPSKAPDVINNSWSCPANEGCTDPNVLLTVVNNVRAAGILTVHSAGNRGPTCSSVREPAGMYDSSFTVGNTTNSDLISSSSSRGPVIIDGSGRTKPDISAPGTYIRSSVPGGGYAILSGTSMAAPHVAGLAALLISAKPELAGQVDLLEMIITRSAAHLTSLANCDDPIISSIHNNTYGWGRIDAWAALQIRGIQPWAFIPMYYASKTPMP